MPDRQSSYDLDFDPKLLERCLFLFNIARRHSLTYPANHPLVVKSIRNFLSLLDELLEFSDKISLGIARDSLLLGDQALKKNAVFRDLAGALFASEIVTLTLHLNLTHEELYNFFKLLRSTPEELRGSGGLNYLLELHGVRGISVKELDFSPLRATEMVEVESEGGPQIHSGEGELPWQSFVKGVMAGTIEEGEGGYLAVDHIDPAELAELLNQQTGAGHGIDDSYEIAITSFLREVNRESVAASDQRDSLRRLGKMADRLTPELRLRLIHSSFNSLAERLDLAEDVAAGLAPETLADILESISEEKLQIPAGLFDMLSKLAEHHDSEGPSRSIKGEQPVDEQLEKRIRSLFRSSNPGQFIPEDYQRMLQDFLAVEKSDQAIPGLAAELEKSLGGAGVESEVLTIILEIIDDEPLSEHADLLRQNLIDLVSFFLEVGDFHSLALAYSRLRRHRHESDAFSVPIALETMEACEDELFVVEVMAAIDNWGREKFDELAELMAAIGQPFVVPLIERLAEEQDMALRQFLLNSLAGIGDPAKQEALRYLHDSRWYLVRNLIALLRRFDDPAIMTAVRRLVGHRHPKVHLEVLKTFLHFQDPHLDSYLLRELRNQDRQRRRNAIFLARNSRDPEVHRELLLQLGGGFSADEYDLRELAVKSLAEIGKPSFWPVLQEQLEVRSLLHKKRHGQFQRLILSSLKNYPAVAAREWLEAFCLEGSDRRLVEFARTVLSGLPEEGI